MPLINFLQYKMELPSKLLEQIAFNLRPKIEELMLILMDKSTHEEHLTQPIQTYNKKFKIALTFLTGYNGIFNVTNSNIKFYFTTSTSDFEPSLIIIPPGAYEIESLDAEIKRICINEGLSTEPNYPFKIRLNFSTLGSIIEIDVGIRRTIDFNPDNSSRDLLGFKPKIITKEYNLSDHPVDILSFDNILFECNIAQGMIFRGKRSGIFHNFTMDVDTGYNYFEKFRGGVEWFMMESKYLIPSNCFKLKNENYQIVSFNGQSFTFRLSIKEL